MDCTPLVAAMVLPARGQATDMDIDASQLPATPPSPQPMQIKQPQVAPVVRDELMEWMDSHTALACSRGELPLLRCNRCSGAASVRLRHSGRSVAGPGPCGSGAPAQLFRAWL